MRARYSFVVLAALTFILAGVSMGFAVGYYHREQTAQQRQGQQIEAKLCTTLGKLAALRPPSGLPGANPSRAYDQEMHAALAQLGPDIGCLIPGAKS